MKNLKVLYFDHDPPAPLRSALLEKWPGLKLRAFYGSLFIDEINDDLASP